MQFDSLVSDVRSLAPLLPIIHDVLPRNRPRIVIHCRTASRLEHRSWLPYEPGVSPSINSFNLSNCEQIAI